jgi:hypothetical protein
VEVFGEEHELVARHPCQGVARPDDAAQPLGHGEQEPVPGVVAVGVVDELEAVEVGEEHRGHGVRPPGALGGVLQPLLQQRPVREPGERVVHRPVLVSLGRGGASSRALAFSR